MVERQDCPTCGTRGVIDPTGAWPAFYVGVDPDHILYIDSSGVVVNGGWRPTFSPDRLTCWYAGKPDVIFKWTAKAPASGYYNDVIDAFRRSVVKEK